MPKYPAILIVVSLVAISLFGFALMGSMTDGSCAGYPVSDCPIAHNLISLASHHVSMIQGYLLAVFNSVSDLALSLMIATLVVLIIDRGQITFRDQWFNLNKKITFARSRERINEYQRIRQPFYQWSALHNKNYLLVSWR